MYSWFLIFLQDLQEKALLQVEQDDPTRQVRPQHGIVWLAAAGHSLCTAFDRGSTGTIYTWPRLERQVSVAHIMKCAYF